MDRGLKRNSTLEIEMLPRGRGERERERGKQNLFLLINAEGAAAD